MRVLVFFGGAMLESRGTPSRVRNLTANLAAIPGLRVLAVTHDPTPSVEQALAIDHREAGLLRERGQRLQHEAIAFRPDVVWGHTHKALAELGHLDCDAVSGRRVIDLHGDFAAEKLEAKDQPLLKRCGQYLRWRVAEARLLRRMDAMTVVSEKLARRWRKLNKPTLVLWGGVDLGLFWPQPSPASDNLHVTYAGNFYSYQGIDVLLDAAAALAQRDEPVEFELVGDSSALTVSQRRCLNRLGSCVTLSPHVPYESVPAVLARAHVLVIPRPESRSAQCGFPSKLPEYLAMGRALVVTDVGEQARVVRDMENGLVVRPGSAEELAAALLRLKDPALRIRLGTEGRKSAEEDLDWGRVAGRVASFFEKLVTDHAS